MPVNTELVSRKLAALDVIEFRRRGAETGNDQIGHRPTSGQRPLLTQVLALSNVGLTPCSHWLSL
jgi:hypothetical protein